MICLSHYSSMGFGMVKDGEKLIIQPWCVKFYEITINYSKFELLDEYIV